MKLVLATNNRHKIEEITFAWAGAALEIVTLDKFPKVILPEEDGATLRENALKKARAAANATEGWALADDTGLMVAALNNAPGVFSARYAGLHASDADNRKKLLEAMKKIPEGERGAYFSCVLALCHSDGREVVVEGKLVGEILGEERGKNGFGYDSIFQLKDHRCTLAELALEEKNKISHRGLALSKMQRVLAKIESLFLFPSPLVGEG